MDTTTRRIAHLDMDAFYASVELLRYPELRGQPVVIGGRRADGPSVLADGTRQFARLRNYAGRGVVTTSTYEARALGVFSAMGMMKAAKLAPDAILLPADFDSYRHYSRLFKAAVATIATVIEDRGIDEIYVDLSAVPGETRELAARIKGAVHEATGLSCSICVAPNKLLAKIGSDLDKPNGLTILTPADVPTRIWPLAVRKINGIGPKASEKLAALGIATVADLAHADAGLLQAHFGRSYAAWLAEASRGIDERQVVTSSEPKQISRETTFERDLHPTKDRGALTEAFTALCVRVAEDLKRKGYVGRTVGIKLRYEDFHAVTRDLTIPAPTADRAVIRRAAGECLRRVQLDKKLRLLGVRAAALSTAADAENVALSCGRQLNLQWDRKSNCYSFCEIATVKDGATKQILQNISRIPNLILKSAASPPASLDSCRRNCQGMQSVMAQGTLRNSGITAVGEVTWGTHMCQFYRSEADLADVLVPYFEAGLRHDESCLWVASDPLDVDRARTLMAEAMPEFKRYLDSGQIEFRSHDEWYLDQGGFDAARVLSAWVEHKKRAVARGHAGLRVTGNAFWMHRDGWHDFAQYERTLNRTLGNYRILCVCSYSLDHCSADDVLEVCRHHDCAISRRDGEWEVLESATLANAKQALVAANAQLEKRVAERTSELRQAVEARDDFLAMLGHELRNPLAPIRSSAEVITSAPGNVAQTQKAAGVITRQVEHLSRMVDDLLDVDRIVRRKLRFELEPVSLAHVLRRAVEISQPEIDAGGHRFSLSLPPSGVTINADAMRLAQAFTNVLNNAAKYTHADGEIGLSASVEAGKAIIAVTDNGPGIAPEMHARIFDLFVQLPRTLDRSEGGLGVGLTLVREIISQHGGTIRVESPGARGTCFRIELPLAGIQKPEHITPHMTRPVDTPEESALRVLVVDDNEDAAEGLGMLLEISGHEVVLARDGVQAIKQAEDFRPEAVLLDIGLPGADGYQVAAALRAMPATHEALLIAISGYGSAEDKARAKAAGFDHHLTKPASYERVERLLTVRLADVA